MTQKSLQAIIAIIGLVLCSHSARAQDIKFGDWIVSQKNNVLFAKTANDTNDEFAKTCSDNSCNWFLYANVPCAPKGGTYNVLINSSKGSAQTTMICLGMTPTAYVFADSGLIDRVIDQATQISVAIPLGNGLIRVSRFSLRGATEALSQLPSGQPSGQSHGPAQCEQLSTTYFSCKSEAESALKKCAVWHGPGRCPYSVPVCVLPSTIDPRCSP